MCASANRALHKYRCEHCPASLQFMWLQIRNKFVGLLHLSFLAGPSSRDLLSDSQYTNILTCRTCICPHDFRLSVHVIHQALHYIIPAMPTTIESQLMISNGNMADWTPRSEIVNGAHFVKLDCKDRSCFRFLTGQTLHFGSKYENTKYLLDFWQYLVRARSAASQTAFETMHKDLQDAAAAGSEDGGRKKRQRIRKARMDDAMVVGRVVDLHVAHKDADHRKEALFGIKK